MVSSIKNLFVFFLTVSLAVSLFSANAITIKGFEPAYAGKTLEFFTWTDPVSKNEKTVFKLVIDDKGNFSSDVPVGQKLFCYCDFGIYRGEVILVPEENISLKLPPPREKSFEESKNPYFEPVEIWLIVNEGSDKALTNLVSRFDARYYKLTGQYFNQLYYRNLKNYQDTIRNKLKQDFSKFTQPDFLKHQYWRLKSLEVEMARTGREKIIGSEKNITAEDWDQPAFVEMFNSLFVNTLSNESKTIGGSRIKQWINQRNVTELKKWTGALTATNSPVTDLVMLKMLHDAFYSGEFSKPSILQILRSDYFSRNVHPGITQITSEVISKLTFLEKGSLAPEICLPLLTQPVWCSTSNTKPYLYVLFADLDIPVCQEQVKYLTTMVGKTGTNLQVFLVILPSKTMNIPDFLRKNQIAALAAVENEKLSNVKMFRVRSYPSAFLLDKNHRVITAPAKTPLDGFEFQFAGIK